MSRYRHLFFDLDNTLWDFNGNSYNALKETFILYQLDLNQFDKFFRIYTYHNERLWEMYRQKGITKEELSRKRFELSFAETGFNAVECTDFNSDYLKFMPEQTSLCEGAGRILKKLHGKYSMYIITNGFSEVQYPKLVKSGIAQYFLKVFVSEEIGYAKPSPEIFRSALKQSNARKRESLMIGDSWEVDILGAAGIGMDQVWLNPQNETVQDVNKAQLRVTGTGTPTHEIRNLEELVTFL